MSSEAEYASSFLRAEKAALDKLRERALTGSGSCFGLSGSCSDSFSGFRESWGSGDKVFFFFGRRAIAENRNCQIRY
jgi:hypothetical protein